MAEVKRIKAPSDIPAEGSYVLAVDRGEHPTATAKAAKPATYCALMCVF